MVLCVSSTMPQLATIAIADLSEFYQDGLEHTNRLIRRQFVDSVEIARQAICEDASEAMVSAALLLRPCHMLANRCYLAESWNSDSLIESGTLDWLVELAGEEVAEVIRLQPHTHRYLVSINPGHYRRLDEHERSQIRRDGGELSLQARRVFARGRYFSQAMQLARWIERARTISCR